MSIGLFTQSLNNNKILLNLALSQSYNKRYISAKHTMSRMSVVRCKLEICVCYFTLLLVSPPSPLPPPPTPVSTSRPVTDHLMTAAVTMAAGDSRISSTQPAGQEQDHYKYVPGHDCSHLKDKKEDEGVSLSAAAKHFLWLYLSVNIINVARVGSK